MVLRMVHTKCRSGLYSFSDVQRVLIKDNEVPWEHNLDGYNPPEYNSNSILNQPWADPPSDDPEFKPMWNKLDGKINRQSYNGVYNILNGRPLNPMGRTGIQGRGRLGRWGPNHAADPIVTRWKVDGENRVLNDCTKIPILQFCVIQRRDNGQWALPGGMIDPGEQITQTLKREFLEEALDSLEASEEKRKEDAAIIEKFFTNGKEVYRGYVDDPRNTDNAWMETVAVNFHDETGETLGKIHLKAGDDAMSVKWMDVDSGTDLYASHSDFMRAVAEMRKAHW